MPSLTDVIAQATSQIKSNSSLNLKSSLQGTIKAASSQVSGILPGIVQGAANQVTTGLGQALNVGLKDVTGAANALIHGDVSGALNQIGGSVSDVLGSLGKSFGLSNGSTLSAPGVLTADPGNSLAGALARSDPQLSFCWYAIMPTITPLQGQPKTLPWYFVEEATPAFRTFQTRSIFHEGRERHYPSTYAVDALTLAIYADSQGVALNYLQAWNNALLSPTTSATAATQGGKYGRPKDYKKSIFIYLLNVAKQQLAVLEYTECWPQTVQAYLLNSNSSDRVLNHVTFSVGDVFMTLYDTSGSMGLLGNNTALPVTNIVPTPLAIPNLGLPSFSSGT